VVDFAPTLVDTELGVLVPATSQLATVAGMPYLRAFTEDVRHNGELERASRRAGLRGRGPGTLSTARCTIAARDSLWLHRHGADMDLYRAAFPENPALAPILHWHGACLILCS